MNRFSRFTHDWRSVPVAVAIMVMMLLATGLAVIFQNEGVYREQKERQTQVQAEILAASVTAALDFGDDRTAQESVDALRVNPQITAAGVYTRDGQLFAGYARSRQSLPRHLGNPGGSPDLIKVTVPVVQAGSRIGSVYMSAAKEPLSRRLTRYSVIALLVVLAALVVGVLGVATTALRRANRELEERAEALGDAYDLLQVEVEERTKAEEQLRQAQKMQALGQLTGGIAHDFNNLLTVIHGSADMLGAPEIDDAKRIRFANAILQTSSRAAALTSQLLAFARRQPLKPEAVNLNNRLTDMIDLLDRTLGERFSIEVELTPGLCAVEVDPAQLEATILNIAVNARDAMPTGGVLTVRTAEGEPLDDGRPSVALSVTDTGVGMDAETLARIFEPFFTTKSVGKGTGLGLSQVYGFAAQSGGNVGVDSTVGAGTTVTITLPCCQGDEIVQNEAIAYAAEGHRTGRILLVDDHEEVGAFAEALLAELGHEVVRKRNGTEALEAARSSKFDVVFTDIVMPGMSGLELAEALKSEDADLPIILTTGYSDEVVTSGSSGLPVLFKPYRPEELAALLDQVLTPPTE